MLVTFLEHSRPLVKTFSASGSNNYPNVKNFTSHVEDVSNPTELFNAIKSHGAQGHCLLKGPLLEPLQGSSRAGKHNKTASNALLVLDLDGLEVPDLTIGAPITSDDLKNYCETVIEQMPEAFHGVSYIAQASASLGMKGNQLSAHLFFVLEQPMMPASQKDLLSILNFKVPLFEQSLSLQNNGKALHYPLDPTMAQNSRIIYIAPPRFKDNIPNPCESRTTLVQKENAVLNAASLLSLMTPAQINSAAEDKVKQLRKVQGLPTDKAKYTNFNTDAGPVRLLANPDAMRLQLSYINGDFAYFNINGGDSNAYFTKIEDPSLIWNFKDEPVFRFQEADPETFQWFLDTHAQIPEDSNATDTAFVFRDFHSGKHWNGIYDAQTKEILKISEAHKGDLEDFLAQHRQVMPPVIPTYDYEFNPKTLIGFDGENGIVNKFTATKYMRHPKELACLTKPGYGNGDILRDFCPHLYCILEHVMNYSRDEILHFINWICYLMRYRDKTQTAWVMSGTPGTGKDSLFKYGIIPLIGVQNTELLGTKDLKSEFRGWATETLLAVGGEFSMKNYSRVEQDAFISWLKASITDDYTVARHMRQDPKSEVNYLNFVFLSNQFDVIKIEPGDRRFNVSPRQEVPIKDVYPNIYEDHIVKIEDELFTFMEFINSYSVDVDAARMVLDNDTKRSMYVTTETSLEAFARAMRSGSIMYFVQNVLEADAITPFDATTLSPAKEVVKQWLERARDGQKIVLLNEVVTIYNAVFGKAEKQAKLSSLLSHHGFPAPTRRQLGNRRAAAYEINWDINGLDINALISEQLTPADQQPIFGQLESVS